MKNPGYGPGRGSEDVNPGSILDLNSRFIKVGSTSHGSEPLLGTFSFSRGSKISGPPELLRLNDFRLRLDRRLLFPPSELRLGMSKASAKNCAQKLASIE